MKIPKLLIVGMGRHGKDTVAEILRDRCGMEFSSSSYAAYEIFIYDLFKDKYGYTSIEEAYADRHNHREELFKLIQEYNSEDRTRLARGIVNSTGMYVGMRCALEVEACIEKDVFDLIIWVDASERVDYVEPSSSISVTKEHADIVLTNNGTLEQLEAKVVALADALGLYVRGIDVDLECIGWEEGTGKYKGKVANLVFRYKDGKEITAMLGKGWTHVMARRMFLDITEGKGTPVGQIFQVYGLQPSSKNGLIRLPKVGELRFDKTGADY